MVDRLTIRKFYDWHLHIGDEEMMKTSLPRTAKHFGRAIMMPNLIPPVRTTANAIAYREWLQKALWIPAAPAQMHKRTSQMTRAARPDLSEWAAISSAFRPDASRNALRRLPISSY